jgi:hypothetical protein
MRLDVVLLRHLDDDRRVALAGVGAGRDGFLLVLLFAVVAESWRGGSGRSLERDVLEKEEGQARRSGLRKEGERKRTSMKKQLRRHNATTGR